MHQSWNNEWSWGNWTLMMVAMVAFWGLVVWAFVRMVRSPDRSSGDTRRSAEQILAGRFAAGEIDTHDYHQHLDALRSTGQSDAVSAQPDEKATPS